MKFSWKSLFLAPLFIPLVYSGLFAFSSPGGSPILFFLILFVFGSVISYGTTIFLFLPCLYLVSKLTPLTARLTGVLGTVLGGVVYLLITWQSYLESGDNSGPPEGTFREYLWQHLFDFDVLAFLIAGLVTAMLYWFLTNHLSRKNDQPTA